MEYVKFGNTGMDVSRICLGMMSFGKPGKENGVFPWAKDYEEGKAIFKKAIDLGINYFDTANVYQMGTSEKITGRYIKDFGLNRDEIVSRRRSILRCVRDGRMAAVFRARTSWRKSITALSVWGSIMSMYTRFTASIHTRRWKRSWRPCTMS